jgi:hypothetical protein
LTLNDSASFHLSIQVSLDGFSFALLNVNDQKYTAIQFYDIQESHNYSELAEKIEQIIAQQELLQQHYSTVTICICNSINALTPKDLYKKHYGKELLGFNQILLQNEDESNDWLKSIECFNSYVIPKELKRCFDKYYPNHSWKHQSTVFIESVMQHYKLNEETTIYISVQNAYFQLVVLEGRKLKFFNGYDYRSGEDIIYYILFACEQLDLNPDQIPIVIAGELEINSEAYKFIHRYIRNISFTNRNPSYVYSFVFDEIPNHYFYQLLNLHLCAS